MSNQILSAAALREHPAANQYLVGVSGGRDSVALLHWLMASGYRNLIVCHFEHGLRGRAGQADARFVERLAGAAGVDFESGAADIASVARASKQSIETAARAQRLAFFTKVGRRRRCLTIFLGHHADDQVETFLMRLFRGAGGAGLAAMRTRTFIGKLEIVRPLLGFWRTQIDDYVAAHALKFREDKTNQKLRPLRNRIRHKVIPFIEREFGREVRRSIWRAATIAAEEDAFFEELFPPQLSGALALGARALREMPIAAQRRIVHKWLGSVQVPDVGFDLVERVRALADASDRIAKTNAPGGRHVRRRAGTIFLE